MTVVQILSLPCVCISATLAMKAASANLQIVHNSADPILTTTDVYINGDLKYNDMQFRTSSGADQLSFADPVVVSIALASSSSEAEAIFRDTLTLTDNANYILILTGVINPTLFAANPNTAAKPTGFDVILISDVRTESAFPDRVDLLAYHGSTDGIGVDLYANENRVFTDVYYGFETGYITLNADTTVFGIAPIGEDPITAFRADLNMYQGQAVLLIASGFLNPGANQNGPVFGLFLVTRQGGPFTRLPPSPILASASVQIIHNASDPQVSAIDIYLGSVRIQDDFAFRSSTSFVNLPANTFLRIGIAPNVSETVQDTIASAEFNFTPGRYVVIANGVIDIEKFLPNPDVRAPSIKFRTYRIDNVKPNATSPSDVDVIFFHGTTDLSSLDLYLNNSAKLADDVVYGNSSGSISIEAGKYLIGLAPAGGQIFDQFYANLAPLAGKSLILMTSGFVNPVNNDNGDELGLYAATIDGGPLISFPRGTSTVGESSSELHITVSPNPANDYIILTGQQSVNREINVTITSVAGTEVLSQSLGNFESGSWRHTIPTEAVAAGIYMVHVKAGSAYNTYPLIIVR